MLYGSPSDTLFNSDTSGVHVIVVINAGDVIEPTQIAVMIAVHDENGNTCAPYTASNDPWYVCTVAGLFQ